MNRLDPERIDAQMREESARSGLPPGIAGLPEIPAARYTDAGFHELDMAALRRSWLYGIHGDELPAAGSVRRWERLGQSLIFVRGSDHVVRCFHNVCRHRGSALVHDDGGEKRKLTCPIHGWSYELDGRLSGVRERRDFDPTDLDGRNLIEVRCEAIGQLYFINLDANAMPLREDLGAIAEAWDQYAPQDSRLVRRVLLRVKANYKLVQEANMEVYHVNTVHPAIVNSLLDSNAAPMTLHRHGHSIQTSRLRKADWTDSEICLPRVAAVDRISKLANVALHMFPNRIIAMNDWGYPMQSYWPLDARNTEVEVIWIAPRQTDPAHTPLWDEIIRTFSTVLEQDFEFLPRTQQALDSGALSGLLIGWQERAIYHAQQELDRRIGAANIPAALRVPPVLDSV